MIHSVKSPFDFLNKSDERWFHSSILPHFSFLSCTILSISSSSSLFQRQKSQFHQDRPSVVLLDRVVIPMDDVNYRWRILRHTFACLKRISTERMFPIWMSTETTLNWSISFDEQMFKRLCLTSGIVSLWSSNNWNEDRRSWTRFDWERFHPRRSFSSDEHGNKINT